MSQDIDDTSLELILQEFVQFVRDRFDKLATTKLEEKSAAVTAALAASLIPGLAVTAFLPGALPLATVTALQYFGKKRESSVGIRVDNKKVTDDIAPPEIQSDVVDKSIVVEFMEFKRRRDIDLALRNVSDTIKLTKKIADLNEDARMGRFADREKKPETYSSPQPLREAAAIQASTRFRQYLEGQGLSKAEIQRISELHEKFVQRELPEISVLSAVQELRDQFHGEPVKLKRPYQGKTKEVEHPDPEEFLLHHYGDDIRAGRLTSGHLYEIDPLLYSTLNRALKAQDRSISDLVEPRGKPYARRAMARAALLGTSSAEEAGRFFASLRADRIAKHEIG